MFELKKLHADSIPAALEKIERYRLLNEPWEAESICRDVLAVDPENHDALIGLLLALTDQFDTSGAEAVREARSLLTRLRSEYEQVYYEGLIAERRAKAQLRRGGPGAGAHAYESYRHAMVCYERALPQRPPGNDEAVLRWNACARTIMKHSEVRPAPTDSFQPMLE